MGSYLQLLCLSEDVRTNPSDVASLLRLNGCDIRQSLLQLQFWSQSSTRPHTGRHGKTKKSVCFFLMSSKYTMFCIQTICFLLFVLEVVLKAETEADSSILPPCDTGCTESKLGLLSVDPDRDIWELLRVKSSFSTCFIFGFIL